MALLALVLIERFSYGPLVWAPNLDPNTYQLYTIYQKGPIEQTPPESKEPITRARRKILGIDASSHGLGCGSLRSETPRGGEFAILRSFETLTQGAQYPLIKEYALNDTGIPIMI